MKAKLLILTTLSVLSAGALSAASETATYADAAAPLIDAAALKTIACAPGVVVLDVRSEKIDGQSGEDYARGHLPCALHSDYVKAGWRAKVEGVPGMLPSVQALEALIGGLGIDNETRVVIAPLGADSKSMAGAARVYWTFKLWKLWMVPTLQRGNPVPRRSSVVDRAAGAAQDAFPRWSVGTIVDPKPQNPRAAGIQPDCSQPAGPNARRLIT